VWGRIIGSLFNLVCPPPPLSEIVSPLFYFPRERATRSLFPQRPSFARWVPGFLSFFSPPLSVSSLIFLELRDHTMPFFSRPSRRGAFSFVSRVSCRTEFALVTESVNPVTPFPPFSPYMIFLSGFTRDFLSVAGAVLSCVCTYFALNAGGAKKPGTPCTCLFFPDFP